MRRIIPFVAALIVASCQSNSSDQIISQKFVHKYGFDISEKEWDRRSQEGQVIATLKNGATVTRTYENGQLHGPAIYTFPNSSTIEKVCVYDQGTLLKETTHDGNGIPMREEVYEFDDRMILTLWNDKGVPLSVEEYNEDLLVDGKYYSADHALDAQVENGNGYRVKRDRSGLLISRDQIENGIMSARTTYHPNGQVHTVSHYHDYQLHGEQMKYTISGRPLMSLHWDRGILDGIKTIYRNGLKVAKVPYVQGQKQGTELHYDDIGNLIAEIVWKDDKKHGCSKFYTEESRDLEWFFNGQLVTAEKFELLEMRQQMLADFTQAAQSDDTHQ